MNKSDRSSAAPIRLLFELERADNPKLYDELVQFTKGTKRVNRLRLLAHEGLLAQRLLMGMLPAGSLELGSHPGPEAGESSKAARTLVLGAFDLPKGHGD